MELIGSETGKGLARDWQGTGKGLTKDWQGTEETGKRLARD